MMQTQRTEADTHRMVCQYLKIRYKDVIFASDFAAGLKLTRYQAAMQKILKSHRGYPDLFIAQPIGKWNGLFLELKRDGTTVWLQNGELTKDKHVREQYEVITQLRLKGYCANFAIGFDDAKSIIDWYLAGAKGNLGLLPKLHPKIKIEPTDELEF